MNPAADWLIAPLARSRFGFNMRLARSARLAARRAHSPAAARPAGDRILRGLQPDLGLQLVLQHGKLGDWRLSEDDGAAGRSVARSSMIDAVTRAYGGGGDELFRIRPDGVDGPGISAFSSSAIPARATLRNIR